MAGSILQHLMLFILQILLAKNLPVSEFGRLSFFNGCLSVLMIFATTGISAWLPAVASRRMQAGQGPPHDMLIWAFGFSVLCAALNAGAYASGRFQGVNVELGPLYYLISATLIPICIAASLQGILVGYTKTSTVFRLNFGIDVARVLFPIILVWKDILGLDLLVAGWCLLQWLAAFVNIFIYLKWWNKEIGNRAAFTPIKTEPVSRVMRAIGWNQDHINALAFLIPSAATLILPRLLVFLTGIKHSAVDTAQVAVAMLFMSAFGVLLIPYQAALLSHFQVERKRREMNTFLIKSLSEVFAIIIGMGLLAWLAAWLLTGPVFGNNLIVSKSLLGVLVLAFACDAPRTLLDAFFATLLSKSGMVVADILRFLGILAAFLIPGLGLTQQFMAVAILSLAANGFKALKVSDYLRRRATE